MTENNNSRIDLRLWKRVLPYVRRVRKHLIVVAAFLFISALGEASYPLFTSWAVNKFVVTGTTDGLPLFTLAFGGVIALGGIVVIIYSRNCIIVEMELGRMLKRDCFFHLQRLPLSFYSTSSVGYLLARVMSDTDKISGVVSWSMIHMLWNICYIVGAFLFMFVLDSTLALIVLAMIPAAALITWFFQRRILVINRGVRGRDSRSTCA